MKKHNIIEINGHRYDAKSGALLASHTPLAGATKNMSMPLAVHTKSTRRTRTIDGMVSPAARATPAQRVHAAVIPKVAPARPKPTLQQKIKHAAAPALQPHQAQRSQTLMRRAVPKPVVSKKVQLKPQLAIRQQQALSTNKIEHKHGATDIHPVRAVRAQKTPLSSAVSRYGNPVRLAAIKPQVARLDIAPSPEKNRTSQSVSQLDVFEQAIAHATSHLEPAPRLPRRRTAPTAALFGLVMIAVIISVGFFTYANMPRIELKIASVQAGFSGSLPQYQPAGFKKNGGVAYDSRKIALTYATANKSRQYTVSQTVSPWDTTALYQNIIAGSGLAYRAVQQQGNTIYIYGDSQAAWVSGGVLYQITGNAQLGNDQLLRIASSV